MGFAATGEAWLPTIRDLFARGNKSAGLEVAVFDNRGIGASSSPADKRAYTTSIMAGDALAVMDALGWSRAHIVGHSMGSMIACRLALEAPQRVASLTLISATGGGSEAIPTNCTAFAAGLRGAIKTDPLSRASVDLAFHFSKSLLKQLDPASGRTVKSELLEQYVALQKATGGQSKAGQDGHMNAVMTHHLTKQEYARLRSAGFPILVIHGAEDILAAPRHAAALARRLGAPLVMIDHSAHFTPRDAAAEVTDELLATVEAVRRGATHADAVHPCPNPAAYERSACAAVLCCCFA
ncbi:hypothetical protein HYH02_012552 [Chlamydomonas schloesseri]|uniref:AB hydrolase-1 domain-containing protein n=1 Tax=Chlamydomonas schloesseri TaxID=2026947 RepID=A0A835T0N2_9CHLO|nr:hypothetical protein HYH02_012552 [Chlamydomonas schloesseri]|eukprot:KAG2433623.1 hypothetical protein HYH02_012552 [Chlamydomonas schloesseri]